MKPELTPEQFKSVREHQEAFKNTNGWTPLNGSPVVIKLNTGIEIIEGVIWNGK